VLVEKTMLVELGESQPKFLKQLVPHSQSSLRENQNFLQNFRSKHNTLKWNFDKFFHLIPAIISQAWHSE
jgi:hypothetical protein